LRKSHYLVSIRLASVILGENFTQTRFCFGIEIGGDASGDTFALIRGVNRYTFVEIDRESIAASWLSSERRVLIRFPEPTTRHVIFKLHLPFLFGLM
jgi:hypothetical protein